MIIFPKTNKKYRSAVTPEVSSYDETNGSTLPPIPPVTTSPKSNITKYLVWGAVIVAAYLLYKKFGNKS